ncbi:hypothetical protein J2S49_000233 [Arcanobacterium wilhelmae]|uniref:DUF3071 domain-containing protein n=1 Tax=Arcanobacterium wilhelmae TaxID=1803177 RepID=A0ABT9N8X3_9ACTO|nr:septation protein SepH [Arcanobacterium wilhelmae]MDP9800157.1 hypothetical protein [Arcanobacterium wilhelmae]WFN89597.1 septation protein SepH [Arcanobacterium wilhelmae]
MGIYRRFVALLILEIWEEYMIDLELLGLVPDGDALSLNDADGNRYRLPITSELRAALRKDVRASAEEPPRPITPKEIQAHFRAGLSVAEVSELTAIPPADLDGLARPILAERQYTALQARRWMLSKEAGSMSLEELVGSRLAARGVDAHSIEWDSYRKNNERMLVAEFVIGEKQHLAQWRIDMQAHTVTATNDEAAWLTETQIPTPVSPWRPLNTPDMSENTASLEARRARHALEAAESPASPDSALSPETPHAGASIDEMLESLDSQRGVAQPMPEFDGAHRADSDVDGATDATIIEFPGNTAHAEQESAASADDEPAEEANSAEEPSETQAEIPNIPPSPEPSHKESKKRKGRPSMPSWDEIVFGYSKDS